MYNFLDGDVRPVYIIGMMHLSDYMTKHDLDDDAVALGIGRSRVTVSRIRRRKVRPDWETIERIKSFTDGAVVADDFQNIDDDAFAPEPQKGAA